MVLHALTPSDIWVLLLIGCVIRSDTMCMGLIVLYLLGYVTL